MKLSRRDFFVTSSVALGTFTHALAQNAAGAWRRRHSLRKPLSIRFAATSTCSAAAAARSACSWRPTAWSSSTRSFRTRRRSR